MTQCNNTGFTPWEDCCFSKSAAEPLGKKWAVGGTRSTLLLLLPQLLGRLSDQHYVSCFFPCRSAVSCSFSHPFKTSHTIRPISSSFFYHQMASICMMPSSAVPHVKSRCPQYPGSNVKRFPVPDANVDWSQKWPQYSPVSYTAPSVTNKPAWADPDIGWATKRAINRFFNFFFVAFLACSGF